MKRSRPHQFDMVDADGEYTPQFEAEFAAYLASLEADADDPQRGEYSRDMLTMDREELRALYAAVTDLVNAGPPPMTPLFATILTVIYLSTAALLVWYVL